MKNKSILILGGGASGLAAAVQAGQMGARVTILERSDRVGKKLLATGNGRCNLANMDETCYFGDTDFARRVLQSMPVADVLGFFDSLGLPTREDASGRVYPACNQAAAVLDVLRLHLERVHARVITGAQAQAILPEKDGYCVRTADAAYHADCVLVCCGGLAAPKLGAVNAYGLLTALGCGLGFFLAMVIFSGVRSRVEDAGPPKSFEGLPITLVSASIVSLSFFGFSGVLDRLFGG